jgi:hypothetical protein
VLKAQRALERASVLCEGTGGLNLVGKRARCRETKAGREIVEVAIYLGLD